jgi:iron complex outermembrane recepter protein
MIKNSIMKKATLIIFLLLPVFCLSQTIFVLKGKVTDTNLPIAWANVILTNSQGKHITGTTTKTDGNFEVKVPLGLYKITISAIGFMHWQKDSAIKTDTDFGQLTLERNTTALGEVIVNNNKNIIEQKIDRLVYYTEKNITLAGGDALQALRTAPGVIVQSNAISILGKGNTQVMIDGRVVELAGEELNNYLTAIAASDIKNIEIMSNPSAKYDANGAGGLININLKKGTRNAWKNSTILSYDQNKYDYCNLRNNFYYNKKNIRFSISANGKLGNSQGKEILDIYYPNGLWQLSTNSIMRENNISTRIALDYDITKNTNIGFQYLGDKTNNGFNYINDIKINNINNNLQSLLINNGINNRPTSSNTYNLHLLSKLDSLNRKISFDIDYFTFDAAVDNNFVAKNFLPDMTFVNIEQAANNVSNHAIKNISIKTDVEHPLKFVNLLYGAKASFTQSKSNVQYYNTITGMPLLDANQSNTFQYKENNLAVYANADKTFKQKISLQIGLRLEHTKTAGYSATLRQKTNNNFTKLFPSFFISYKLNDSNQFNFTYGKRINRPQFGLLNPFRSYINSNSYSEGNPFLQPSFSNNFECTYTYKEKWRTNAFVNITTEGFGIIFTANPSTNTQKVTRGNYYKEYYFGIGESYTATITKHWENQTSLYALAAKTNFTTSIQARPTNGVQLYFSSSNSFSVSNTTKLQVDCFYSSPYKRGLYKVGYMAGVNIAIRKDLLAKKMQLSLLINDVFNSAYLKNYASIVNGINQVYSQNNSSRFFRASLTYSIGNKKIQVKQRDFGNEEEKERAGK